MILNQIVFNHTGNKNVPCFIPMGIVLEDEWEPGSGLEVIQKIEHLDLLRISAL